MLTTAVIQNRVTPEINGLLSLLDVPVANFGWDEKTILLAIVIQARTQQTNPIELPAAPDILSRPAKAIDSAQLALLNTLFEWPGHKADTTSQRQTHLTEADQRQFALGRQQYLTTCAGCHGNDGAGLARFAPTLIGSDWVLGDEKRLALLILHGLEGPVEVAGKKYDVPDILPVMPAHSIMDDGDITAIMTYIRNEWGNHAGAVGRRVVGTIRHTSQGRVVPWTAKELNQHMLDTKPPESN
jgi:mono/diheme cytochrome c family protein